MSSQSMAPAVLAAVLGLSWPVAGQAPAKPAVHPQLAIYQHFVATPVPIGAVTSPVSMLNPLMVTIAKPAR